MRVRADHTATERFVHAALVGFGHFEEPIKIVAEKMPKLFGDRWKVATKLTSAKLLFRRNAHDRRLDDFGRLSKTSES